MAEHKKLEGLQILRGFCATAVVVSHASGMTALPKYGGQDFFNRQLEYGFLGVDIFFVISAFIIATVNLRGREWAPHLTARSYFAKRFVRIVPLMWLAILSYAVLQFAANRAGFEIAGYVRALFLLPFSTLKPDVIWTLRQEFLFYLIFCLAFFGPKPLRWLILVWVLSPIAYVASLGSMTATTAFIDSTASILFSTVNLEFGAGLILGLAWVRSPPAGLWRSPVHPLIAIYGLGLVLFALVAATGFAGQTLPLVLTMGATGALLVGFSARVHCPPGLLTGLGELLGDASYSIYLFHLHLQVCALTVLGRLHLTLPAPVMVAGLLALSLAGGVLIHLLIEKPLIRWTGARVAGRATR